MHISIINDCACDNVMGRQLTRTVALLNNPSCLVRVKNDVEAAGNVIDLLDAGENRDGLILVNIAPRCVDSWWLRRSAKHFKERENGTPFCYFWVNKVLVISSVDGLVLSLIKKLKITDNINVIDMKKTLEIMHEKKFINSDQVKYIESSQFRSFDFTPRVAHLILNGINPFVESVSIDNIPDMENCVWWIDNFGNCKTTLLESEIRKTENNKVKLKFGEVVFTKHLKDVPRGESALISGSSGLGNERFLELVNQGGNFAEIFGVNSGDSIL